MLEKMIHQLQKMTSLNLMIQVLFQNMILQIWNLKMNQLMLLQLQKFLYIQLMVILLEISKKVPQLQLLNME